MKLEYLDLLSGEPIFINNIGRVRSPIVREIKSVGGIGQERYSLYLNIFAWDKNQIIDNLKNLPIRGIKALSKVPEKFNNFDIMILIPQMKKLLAEAMAFFIVERIKWEEQSLSFVVFNEHNKEIGRIDRNNFDVLCEVVLKVNYVGVNKDKKINNESGSKTALSRWEKAQEFLQKQNKSSNEDEEYSLGNIISKLCVVHQSYNLFNVYELTIFQLYDQFFQYCYLHATDLNERIFSIHGGENFKGNEWLKNINKN